MYGKHDARRLEHLTVLMALLMTMALGGAATAGAWALSHRLGKSSDVVAAPGTLKPPPPSTSSPPATASTTAAANPPSFTTSTISGRQAATLQLSGQATPAGAGLRVTVVVQLEGSFRQVAARTVSVSDGGLCSPQGWSGVTDARGRATTTFSCALAGPDVALLVTSGLASEALVLHR